MIIKLDRNVPKEKAQDHIVELANESMILRASALDNDTLAEVEPILHLASSHAITLAKEIASAA